VDTRDQAPAEDQPAGRHQHSGGRHQSRPWEAAPQGDALLLGRRLLRRQPQQHVHRCAPA